MLDQFSKRLANRSGEAGAVLVIVMLVMMVLMGMGVTALYLAAGNTNVAASMNQRTMALYSAEGGLERAKAILNGPAGANLTALLRGLGHPRDNVPTALDAAGLPNGVGAILFDGAAALDAVNFPGATAGRTTGTADNPTADRLGSFTVWIRNDTAEIRAGFFNVDGGNRTVTLRAQGVALDGRTTVTIETVLSPATAAGANAPGTDQTPAKLCYAGKNGCSANDSTPAGMAISAPGSSPVNM
jgi:hypothetical protein